MITFLGRVFLVVGFLFCFKIFFCGPFLKSLSNLLQYCFCFMFWFFGCEACGILAPQPGIEPAPPALEGKVLTTGPPRKSLGYRFFSFHYFEYVIHSLLTCKVSAEKSANSLMGIPLYMPIFLFPPLEFSL